MLLQLLDQLQSNPSQLPRPPPCQVLPGPPLHSIHPLLVCQIDIYLNHTSILLPPLPPSPLSHLPASKWLPQPPRGHSSASRIASLNSSILMSSTCIKLLRAPCSKSGGHIQTPWPGVTNPFPPGSFFLSRLAWHHLLHAYPSSGAPQMPCPYSPLPLRLPALCP